MRQEATLLSPFDTLMNRRLEDLPSNWEKCLAFRRAAVDILESETAYQIKADLPDIDPKT